MTDQTATTTSPSGLTGAELAAAVLHYAEGTLAPVDFHPAGCATCSRAVELVDAVNRTYRPVLRLRPEQVNASRGTPCPLCTGYVDGPHATDCGYFGAMSRVDPDVVSRLQTVAAYLRHNGVAVTVIEAATRASGSLEVHQRRGDGRG